MYMTHVQYVLYYYCIYAYNLQSLDCESIWGILHNNNKGSEIYFKGYGMIRERKFCAVSFVTFVGGVDNQCDDYT